MLEDLDQMLAWLLAALIRPTSGLYGEYDLRPGDRDPAPEAPARYGGQERPELTGTTHVRDLHRDLRELGFLLAPADATTFTTATWLAVMEFQRYASLPDSATEREPGRATLTEGMAADSPVLKAGPRSAFPAAPPFRVCVDGEVLEVGGVTADGFGVTRGVQDTVAAAHAAGAEVELIRWSDRLVPVPARFYERYAEPITGVVNPWTRFVLRRWKQRRRRCPIVVEAWDLRDNQPDRLHRMTDGRAGNAEASNIEAGNAGANDVEAGSVEAGGVWAGNVWGREVTANGPRFYVRDLTRTWPRPARPPVAPAHPELDVAGDWRVLGTPPPDVPPDWQGPRSWPEFGHTWRPEGEMLPEHLLPAPGHDGSEGGGGRGPTLRELLDAADRAPLSTYKVVRAVSEVEAVGYFDGLNAYDRAFVSLGPCHWTAGLAAGPAPGAAVGEAELPGFLAYLKATDRVAFAEAVGRFGIDVALAWGANGAALFDENQRKYTSRPAVPQEGGGRRPLATVEEYDMFRGWHWFYRFQMAARTVDGFRRAMWPMARLRIRDIGETPWDAPAGPPTWTVPSPDGPRPARVKEVVTSERGMALVYRWHIRAPANMVSGGRAGPVLRGVHEAAVKEDPAAFAGTPDTWGDAAERALVAELRKQGGGSIEEVHEWPRLASRRRGFTLPVELLPEASDGGGRRLAVARGSFELDTSGLPFPPL
ncbi:hypothetical protein ACBJ59_46955 [Nonomuraea sp. MTCD27]|uniref:hypothetical protein n=1 Tax=Nonomuraea sp. MTCD27 TaxID=1676747 RepID=UPI0035C02AB5